VVQLKHDVHGYIFNVAPLLLVNARL